MIEKVSIAATPELLDALDEAASALQSFGAALGSVVAAVRSSQKAASPSKSAGERPPDPIIDTDVSHGVHNLFARLGEGNRRFIADAALAFAPGEDFSLEELADATGETPGSARARLMNIGRSLKSLRARGVLWDAVWSEDDRATIYTWTYEGHKAVLREIQ